MIKRLPVYALFGVMGLFVVTNSQAQQTQSSEQQLQQLVRDLQTQLQRGETERLADPWFIRDLQKLIAPYDNPWQQQILFDDFSSRGPAPAAPWQVKSGEFLIDWRFGLRSVVTPGSGAKSSTSSKSSGKEDLAAALLGAFLEQALEGDKAKESKNEPTATTAASVNASLPVPNAFSIDLQFSTRDVNGQQSGHLLFGPYQTGTNGAGYRLHYYNGTAKGEPSLSLTRVSSRGGESMLDLYAEPLSLIDGNAHQLRWTRDAEGSMTISLDGKRLLEVRDRSYRDAFDGLLIENHAGDFAIRQVEMHGGR